MAQHDMNIINADGATVRGDINDALAALVSNNEGLSAPSPSYASMWWPDRTNGLLKQRNAANSAWIIRGTLADAPVEARASNTILGVADYGKTILASGTWTQTLTAAATLGNGWWCEIRNDGTGTITLDPNASETIDGATTIALAAGESCKVVCDGAWFKTASRGVVKATAAEAQAFVPDKFIDGALLALALQGPNQSLTSSGHQLFPGGLIVQWGAGVTNVSGQLVVTFPIAFPNAARVVIPVLNHSTATPQHVVGVVAGTASKTGVTIACSSLAGGASAQSVGYIAIGN